MKGFAPATQACLEAWISCENLLSEISLRQPGYAPNMEKTLDECAHICMETWQSFKQDHGPVQVRKMVLLCIGICEECAEACNRYQEMWFHKVAQACRKCADHLAAVSMRLALYQ